MPLKVVSQVQTATGEYGNLRSEVTRNGEVTTVAIQAEVKGGFSLPGAKQYLPKYHFTDVEEMQNLVAALNDAIAFLGGTK